MDLVKSPGYGLEQLLPGWRQFDGTVQSSEQSNSRLLFKRRDLSAHRALREAQLVCGNGEAQMTCNRLEGAKQIQRRKSVLLHRYSVSPLRNWFAS